jgi:protein gp37
MADGSSIEWTDASWNCIRARNLKTGKVGWHCEHATTGCEFCYAEGFNKRLGTGLPFKPGHRADIEIFLDEEMLTLPLRWKRPRRIFVCSMTDLFADFVPDEFIDKMFAVMALAPQHTFQVLTKRAERMRNYLTTPARVCNQAIGQATHEIASERDIVDPCAGFCMPLPNVWLGVSTERQPEADERIIELLKTPAAVHFVSAEPLLGRIDLTDRLQRWHEIQCDETEGQRRGLIPGVRLDWVIAGGESGPNARPMHPQWARDLRDQCKAAAVPFFFKQHGEWIAGAQAAHLGDADLAEYPTIDLQTPSKSGGHLGNYCFKVGKKTAGRLLDGVEHNGFPKVAA